MRALGYEGNNDQKILHERLNSKKPNGAMYHSDVWRTTIFFIALFLQNIFTILLQLRIVDWKENEKTEQLGSKATR